MALLYQAQPKNRGWRKPQGRPLAIDPVYKPRGLVYAWPMADASYTEMVTGLSPARSTSASSVTMGNTPYGSGPYFGTGSTNAYLGYSINTGMITTSTTVSFEILAYATSGLSGGVYAWLCSSATPIATASYFFSLTASSGDLVSFFDNGAGSSSTVAPSSSIFHVCVTIKSGTQNFYVNGNGPLGTPGSSTFAFTAGSTAAVVFGTAQSSDNSAPIVVLNASMANVVWSQSEIMARFTNPYSMYLYEQDLWVGRSYTALTSDIHAPVLDYQALTRDYDAPMLDRLALTTDYTDPMLDRLALTTDIDAPVLDRLALTTDQHWPLNDTLALTTDQTMPMLDTLQAPAGGTSTSKNWQNNAWSAWQPWSCPWGVTVDI